MPRKPPDGKGVIEHRLTLGDFERKLIKKQLDEDDLLNKAKTGAQIGKSIAITGAVVGGTIAAATIGGLAVSAYREANQLVEGAQDLGAGIWSTFKWRTGLISFDDYLSDIGDITTESEEEKAEKQRRKNMGILEWGLDNLLVFLLGEDKKWTRTTLVKEDELPADEQPPNDDEYRNFQELYDRFGGEQAYNNWNNQRYQYQLAMDQFCDVHSADYDPGVCEELTEDFNQWLADTDRR